MKYLSWTEFFDEIKYSILDLCVKLFLIKKPLLVAPLVIFTDRWSLVKQKQTVCNNWNRYKENIRAKAPGLKCLPSVSHASTGHCRSYMDAEGHGGKCSWVSIGRNVKRGYCFKTTHFYLRLYGVGHMIRDHSDSELPPHGLLFSISSKGSFICTIPQTG